MTQCVANVDGIISGAEPTMTIIESDAVVVIEGQAPFSYSQPFFLPPVQINKGLVWQPEFIVRTMGGLSSPLGPSSPSCPS